MLRNDGRKNTLGQLILALYLIGYLTLSILPMVKYSVPYIISGSYCLLFALYFFIKPYRSDKYRLRLLLLLVVGVMHGGVAFLQNNASMTEIINEPIRVVRYIVPCFVFAELSDSPKWLKILIWSIISALFGYVLIRTVVELNTGDQMLARILAAGSDSEYYTQYRMQNIGGFEISYAFGLTAPLWVMLLFCSKKAYIKIISLGAVAFILYYSILSEYMTLFLLSVVSILIAVVLGQRNIVTKIIAILITFFILIFSSSILRWISSFVTGELAYRRLNNFAKFIEGSTTIDQTTSRVVLYREAFIAFITNPFFGQTSSVAAADSHSTIFGTMASTGIVGMIALITEFVIYYKTSKEIFINNNVSIRPFNIAFIAFVFLAFVNPIGFAYEISIAIFLYIPLTLDLFFDNKNNYYETNKKNNKVFVRRYH